MSSEQFSTAPSSDHSVLAGANSSYPLRFDLSKYTSSTSPGNYSNAPTLNAPASTSPVVLVCHSTLRWQFQVSDSPNWSVHWKCYRLRAPNPSVRSAIDTAKRPPAFGFEGIDFGSFNDPGSVFHLPSETEVYRACEARLSPFEPRFHHSKPRFTTRTMFHCTLDSATESAARRIRRDCTPDRLDRRASEVRPIPLFSANSTGRNAVRRRFPRDK